MRACTAALRQSLFSVIRTSTAIVWQLLQCAVWAAICAAEGKMPSSSPFPATRSKFARTSAPSRCLFLRSFFSLYAVARVRLQFLFISRPNPNSFHRLLHQLNSNDKISNAMFVDERNRSAAQNRAAVYHVGKAPPMGRSVALLQPFPCVTHCCTYLSFRLLLESPFSAWPILNR